jgi:hypothetical protein
MPYQNSTQLLQKILYQMPFHKSRILVPKTIQLVSLSILFLIALLINISLVDMNSDTEKIVIFTSFGIVGMLFFLGLVLNYSRAIHGVKFFDDHFEIGHKKIKYLSIGSIEKRQNFLDKRFNTYTLHLDKKRKIEAIPISIDLHSYLQRLISYNKARQQQL